MLFLDVLQSVDSQIVMEAQGELHGKITIENVVTCIKLPCYLCQNVW